MIPILAIADWENDHPWANKRQVEQDLIIRYRFGANSTRKHRCNTQQVA
jgi:hypothetical protein